MSSTTTLAPHVAIDEGHDTAAPRANRRPRWPIFGIVAGVTGSASAIAGISKVTEEQAAEGLGVLDHLTRGTYHVSFVLGIVALASLFVAATGWKRWAEQRAPRDLAARTIGTALGATATVNIVFTCLAGSMALYLPGGTDHGWLPEESIFVNYSLLDFGQLLGWWGAAVAAVCVVTLSLRRSPVLPRWMGVVSVVLLLPPLGLAAATSLPGFVGLTMPIWLVVTSVGLVFSSRAKA
ncbi:MAG: hypothetical protein QM733_22790 [Ilumatobacteraceae bacterium]